MVSEAPLGERLVRLTIRLIRVDSRSRKRRQACVGILVGLPLPRSFDKLRMTGGFFRRPWREACPPNCSTNPT